MEVRFQKPRKLLSKALVAILGLLIVGLASYILVFPFWPAIQYNFWHKDGPQAPVAESQLLNSATIREGVSNPAATSSLSEKLPMAEAAEPGNRLIIPKIGVDIPIVDSANADWALSRGAWRMPETSTPDKGSNTAIAGHRFKYLPPNNLTFYLLDKLAKGDILTVFWSQKEYDYIVVGSKIVSPDTVSVLDPTPKPTVTLITCDPIWTQKNRLVVTAELIE